MTTERELMLESLEVFIDNTSLHTVLEMLSAITFDKAEHIHINWGDYKTGIL